MSYEEMISRVAEANGYDRKIVDKAYKAFWRAIREHIVALPLKEDLADEEFLKLKPNVNIPSIGKLYVTLDRYKRLRNKYKSLQSNDLQEN